MKDNKVEDFINNIALKKLNPFGREFVASFLTRSDFCILGAFLFKTQ